MESSVSVSGDEGEDKEKDYFGDVASCDLNFAFL